MSDVLFPEWFALFEAARYGQEVLADMSDRFVIGHYVDGKFQGRFCSTALFGHMPFAVTLEFDNAPAAIEYLLAPPHDAWSYDLHASYNPDHNRFERNPNGRTGLWSMDDVRATEYLDGYLVIDTANNAVKAYRLDHGVVIFSHEETWDE